MTPAEKILWEEVHAKKLGVRFRRQQVIAGLIVDFYCHKAALVIEVDGPPSNLRSPPPNSKFVEFGGGWVGASWG